MCLVGRQLCPPSALVQRLLQQQGDLFHQAFGSLCTERSETGEGHAVCSSKGGAEAGRESERGTRGRKGVRRRRLSEELKEKEKREGENAQADQNRTCEGGNRGAELKAIRGQNDCEHEGTRGETKA
jgi:hypothetical protein